MANSPFMGFPLSVIGSSTGLEWEQNVNQALTTIDGHNHTSGSGVQIPPGGLNINTALPFNNQQATDLQAVVFTPQTSLATYYGLYSIGTDLYFNDGAGNVIQITKSGNVNATASGIASGTATAGFSSGVLVVNSATSTPGNIQAGSYLMGDGTTDGYFVTLSPPTLSSSYDLVLPAIPGSAKFVTLDTSGNFGTASAISGAQIASGSLTATQFATVTDGVTLDQSGSGSTLEVKTGGITATQIATGAVTSAKLASNLALVGVPTISPFGPIVSGVSGLSSNQTLIQWAAIASNGIIYQTSGDISIVTNWATGGVLRIGYVNPGNFNPCVIATSGAGGGTSVAVSSFTATTVTLVV